MQIKPEIASKPALMERGRIPRSIPEKLALGSAIRSILAYPLSISQGGVIHGKPICPAEAFPFHLPLPVVPLQVLSAGPLIGARRTAGIHVTAAGQTIGHMLVSPHRRSAMRRVNRRRTSRGFPAAVGTGFRILADFPGNSGLVIGQPASHMIFTGNAAIVPV